MLFVQGDLASAVEQTGATFQGSLEYVPQGGSLGTLTITLTNTSPSSVGGFLTAFVFNVDSTDSGSSGSEVSKPNNNWSLLLNESAAPFGSPYDLGSSTSGGFEGGGPPSRGLAIGETGTWIFNIQAADAAVLTEDSFVNGPFAQNFVVRFRGLDNGGSDKVGLTSIPTPGALALVGVAGLVGLRRRRD